MAPREASAGSIEPRSIEAQSILQLSIEQRSILPRPAPGVDGTASSHLGGRYLYLEYQSLLC
ncbi:MAG TPA: hypothetical protein VJU61_11125 [Polyangiaceae bacterium]|nr:hypothetical protein [Polyangiaceae bacterium]